MMKHLRKLALTILAILPLASVAFAAQGALAEIPQASAGGNDGTSPSYL
jgi:hypothetical protein